MKHLLFVLFFFCSLTVISQVRVVVNPKDTIVCFRDSVAFTTIVTGAGTSVVSYRWQKNYIDITGPGATDSIYGFSHVISSSPGIYRCIVSVEGLGSDTSNDAILRMYPRMYIDTLYRYNPLGCAGECKGQFKTHVSGGTPFSSETPYIYEWHGGHSQDTIVFGLCPRHYRLTVTDSLGCSIDSNYYVDFLKSPKVTFSIEPDTVIYLTNPTIQVTIPSTMTSKIANWTWNFGDSVKISNLSPVSHTYRDTTKPGLITVRLSFTDLNGCDTTITGQFTLKIAKLTIPNLFTPNGDNVNDKFEIQLEDDKSRDFREAYLGNELLVYDRWGRKVFNKTDYKSEDWDGNRLSDGTYFYILRLTGQYGDEVNKGSVTILR
jgi:gliding motility-associated-like protein